ncbi:MAG: phosphate ABC transporter ATP-binding protein [Elusimicrobia bacterium RIFOXYA2_FULL_50_26]|nr:MAG: phosphate ABC transporter ATP-binding protein [Elusimicrobia bacterium RIFOXYA2_FULL_50_26]OGS24539.1 MAG: phosphate ABC transporter ATP-binding protein [Elusimicrobia bacterium RIFOXYB2_FULL_50_12]
MSKISVENLNLYYQDFHALRGVNVEIAPTMITSMIGPSGCGKSTLLRTFNRMNDLVDGVRVDGKILIDGDNILPAQYDLVSLRKKVGMVFQRPNPFPMSIASNIKFGLEVHGVVRKDALDATVEDALRAVSLWDELKDRLSCSALGLSLEQQQRLCIARLIAVKPEILLMDEPCSALDPIATERVEELMIELKANYTIVIVTHNMQQAARISDYTGFMWLGELVEFGRTDGMFTNPKEKLTQDYITGRAG